jgi:hypothetical protein
LSEPAGGSFTGIEAQRRILPVPSFHLAQWGRAALDAKEREMLMALLNKLR